MSNANQIPLYGKLAVVLLICIFAISNATAPNLEVIVIDFNTLQAIANATVKVYNGTDLIGENLTDANGLANFTTDYSYTYTVITTMTFYEGDNQDVTMDSNKSLLVRLVPYSADGIIRFRYSDLTGIRIKDWFGGNHELCFYYESNNRLHGCYNGNETIQLLEQQDYIIRLKPMRQDMINAPDNLLTFTKQYTSYIIVLIFLISFISILYFVQKTFIANKG